MFCSLDICAHIAHALKDAPSILMPTEQAFESTESLAWGGSGIALFYALLHQKCPHENWDKVAHAYIKMIGKKIETQTSHDLSLFKGFTGYACGVYICSQHKKRYQNLLNSLDQTLFHEISSHLEKLEKEWLLDTPLSPCIYNVTQGLAGYLVYLLHRYDDFPFPPLLPYVLRHLVQLFLTPKKIHGKSYLPWTVSLSNEGINEGYYTNIPDGITGVLAVLVMAAEKGIWVEGQYDLISQITLWLRENVVTVEATLTWPYHIPLEPSPPQSFDETSFIPPIWQRGAPGIARTLFRSAAILRDRELKEFSQETVFKALQKGLDSLPFDDCSLGFGYGGLLMIAQRMGYDTELPSFYTLSQKLEDKIKTLYRPTHSFGFQMAKEEQIDNPYLLQGAAGVGLALLARSQDLKQELALLNNILVI